MKSASKCGEFFVNFLEIWRFFYFLVFRKWEYCGRIFHLKFEFSHFGRTNKQKKTDPEVLIIRRLLLLVFMPVKSQNPAERRGVLFFGVLITAHEQRRWFGDFSLFFTISPKREKNRKWSDFPGFPSPEVKKNWVKNRQISIFGFESVAMNTESWLKRFVHHIWFIARFG